MNSPEFYTVCFYCMLRLSKYIKTKLQANCFYFILDFFYKVKRSLELVSPASYSA